MTATVSREYQPVRTAVTRRARRTTPVWWADAAGSLAVLSVVAVVALWVRNRGVQDLGGGWWAAATSWGRLTGLVSADLMLVQVVLNEGLVVDRDRTIHATAGWPPS